MQKNFGEQVIAFNQNLKINFLLPERISVLNPFIQQSVVSISKQFYKKYYDDYQNRIFIFGINPGRFGAGVTGIPFTDPIRLKSDCGIENNFRKIPELSSSFVYELIHKFGGAEKFYQTFYITAVCPLGFTMNGKNLNYYDDKKLLESANDFMVRSIDQQVNFGAELKKSFCWGEGKNYKLFQAMNEKHKWFEKIIPLPHPRWIMQYRRKRIDEFIKIYLDAFSRSAD